MPRVRIWALPATVLMKLLISFCVMSPSRLSITKAALAGTGVMQNKAKAAEATPHKRRRRKGFARGFVGQLNDGIR